MSIGWVINDYALGEQTAEHSTSLQRASQSNQYNTRLVM